MFLYNIPLETVTDYIYYHNLKLYSFQQSIVEVKFFANNSVCSICMWKFKKFKDELIKNIYIYIYLLNFLAP